MKIRATINFIKAILIVLQIKCTYFHEFRNYFFGIGDLELLPLKN